MSLSNYLMQSVVFSLVFYDTGSANSAKWPTAITAAFASYSIFFNGFSAPHGSGTFALGRRVALAYAQLWKSAPFEEAESKDRVAPLAPDRTGQADDSIRIGKCATESTAECDWRRRRAQDEQTARAEEHAHTRWKILRLTERCPSEPPAEKRAAIETRATSTATMRKMACIAAATDGVEE